LTFFTRRTQLHCNKHEDCRASTTSRRAVDVIDHTDDLPRGDNILKQAIPSLASRPCAIVDGCTHQTLVQFFEARHLHLSSRPSSVSLSLTAGPRSVPYIRKARESSTFFDDSQLLLAGTVAISPAVEFNHQNQHSSVFSHSD